MIAPPRSTFRACRNSPEVGRTRFGPELERRRARHNDSNRLGMMLTRIEPGAIHFPISHNAQGYRATTELRDHSSE